MKSIYTGMVATSMLLLSACGNSGDSEQPVQERMTIGEFNTIVNIHSNATYSENARNIILEANIALGLTYLKRNDQDNYVISPLRQSHSLAMLLAGADGETYHKVLSDLRVSDTTEISIDQRLELVNAIAAVSNKPYMPVNTTVMGQQNYPFATDYLAILKNSFGASLSSAHLYPENTRIINENAFQISTNWDNSVFTLTDTMANFETMNQYGVYNQVTVPMKAITGSIPYYSNSFYEAFELTIFSSPVRLLIIMPFHGQFDTTLDQLSSTSLTEINLSLESTDRTVNLPYFSVNQSSYQDYPYSSNDDFSAINLEGQLFLRSLNSDTQLSVTDSSVQGTAEGLSSIEAVPQGSDGPLSGSVIIVGPPPSTTPCYDPEQARPFIFILQDSADNSILFIGQVSEIAGGPVTPTSYASIGNCP